EPAGGPLVFANGRRLMTADLARLTLEIDEERALVQQLIDNGIAPDLVQRLVEAAAEPPPTWGMPEVHRFLIANWHALPRLGPVDAPVVVFWRMNPLSPGWHDTMRALERLHDELGADVAIVFTPVAQREDDPALRLFQ